MATPPYIPSFYFSKFAQGISEPYTATSAYQAGAIDANGNFIKPESSIDPLEYLIIKLKKIFEELPMGMTKAQLNNYMSTMQLFGEEAKHFGITDSEFMGLMEANLALNGNTDISYIELCEDMGAAGMASAGTSPSYNTGSVSGYDPAMGTTRREQPVLKGLDSCEMFDVCPEEMRAFKSAKAWKHVPDSDTKRYLQRYQRRNPKGHMALRSMNPDTGESDLYWINYPSKSLLGEAQEDPLVVMAQNVVNEPKEDRNIKGAKVERIGRLVLSTQSFKDALKTGSKGAISYVRDKLASISDKPISNNETDAYSFNSNSGEMEPKDVKGHTTSVGGYIDVAEYPQHRGIPEVMGRIREKIKDVDTDPEIISKEVETARTALRKLGKENIQQLKDITVGSVGSEDWAVLPSTSGDKPFRFPFKPSFVPVEKVKSWVASATPKYGLRTSGNRAEVKIRIPDISTAKAQRVLSQDRETGEMTSAQMDPESLEILLQKLKPELQTVIRKTLSPFVKS
jgi:hypothetical protein